jgi:predicted nucleic acid-binding protein
MKVLVDTSVWIDHLRFGDEDLSRLLDEGGVLCHPFVMGELACGNLRNRSEILDLLGNLPSAAVAQHDEVLRMVEERTLSGKGIGWIDMHLIASALLSACTLWTRDRHLTAVTKTLKITHNEGS